MTGIPPRLATQAAVLDLLCSALAAASELFDPDDVTPLDYAYRHLCETTGEHWGRTLDQAEYDAFKRAMFPQEVTP